MRISDWSSDVCSSDLLEQQPAAQDRLAVGLLGRDVGRRHRGQRLLRVEEEEAQKVVEHAVVGVGDELEEGRRAVLDIHVVEEQPARRRPLRAVALRSEEHTSELQSLMRISYAVFCLNK